MFGFYFKNKIKSILIFTIVIIFFLMASLTKFEAFAADTENTKQLLDSFPKVIMVVYGMSDLDITTIGGYFAVVSLYTAIMLSIYGAILGSKIIYEEEDIMTSEFIFTRPVSRTKVYITKLLVALLTITILNILVIIGNYFILSTQYEVFDGFEIISLVQYVLCIFSLSIGALLTTLKANRFATIASAATVTSLFLVKAIGELKEINLSLLTPFYAFNNSNILNDSFNMIYVYYYLILSVIFIVAGSFILNKRDIK